MVWVGRDIQRYLVQATCHGQGHLSQEQVAQRPIQPDLGHFQCWAFYYFSGQSVPVSHHPCHKKGHPYIQSKPTFFQFKTIAPCPVTTGPGKMSVPFFLISPLYILKGPSKVFPRLKSPNSLSLSAEERGSSLPTISMALLWTCSNRSMSFLYWGPRAGRSTAGGLS